jgi:3-isopropylmalate/(R)-2-methylmalate dehydratase small subunit
MPVEQITRVSGTAVALRGDNIDTDRIIPARFLRSVSFEGLEAHLFADDRAQAGDAHPFSTAASRSATLLFVNANFGCGSSREHAPQAIRRWGVRAIVGQSFSEIFFGNSLALGLPCVTVDAETAGRLQSIAETDPSAVFALDLEQLTLDAAGTSVRVHLPDAAREAFVLGSWDATGLLLDRYEEVRATAERLPYINQWKIADGRW